MKLNQNGRSMVEMLGVLAIIGVLSIGAMAGYSKAMFKHKINKTINHISMIISGISNLYANKNSFEDLGGSVLEKTHIVPEELYTEMNDYSSRSVLFIKNGKTVLSILAQENGQSVSISFSDISEEECVQFFSYDWSGIDNIRGIAYGVSDRLIPKNCTNGDKLSGNIAVAACTFPVSIADAEKYCTSMHNLSDYAPAFQVVIEK